MNTPADRSTSKQWRQLASRINSLYAKAADELEQKAQTALSEYNNDFEAMDAKRVQSALKESERYKELRDAVVNSILQCDHIATDWIAKVIPSVWRDDMLYSTYVIEGMTHGGVSLRLLDDQTINRLIQRTPHLLPKVDDAKNGAYIRKKFNAEITQGIIQGESVDKIAKRIETVSSADKAAAMRQARTAITSARNGARQEVAERAVDMGIDIEKRWLATLDGVTRDSHQHLDGETVPVDKKFSNGLMFPGDSSGRPEELYNCRCTLTYVDDETGKPARRDNETGDVIGWETYDEWSADKQQPTEQQKAPVETLAGAPQGKPMTFDEANELRANPKVKPLREARDEYEAAQAALDAARDRYRYDMSKEELLKHQANCRKCNEAVNKAADKYNNLLQTLEQYDVNCQTCVVANEARRRGFDVCATGNKPGSINAQLAHDTTLAWIDPATGQHPKRIIYDGAGTKDPIGNPIPTKGQYWKWLNEDGRINEGERYTIQFPWAGRSQTAHIVNLERIEEGLRIYDPQQGKSYVGNEAKAYLSQIKYATTSRRRRYATGPEILRIDNMDFDKSIVEQILIKA